MLMEQKLHILALEKRRQKNSKDSLLASFSVNNSGNEHRYRRKNEKNI